MDSSTAGYWASSSSNSVLVTTSALAGVILGNWGLLLVEIGARATTREPTSASTSADAMNPYVRRTDIRSPYAAPAAVADRVWASNQQCVCRAVKARVQGLRLLGSRLTRFRAAAWWCEILEPGSASGALIACKPLPPVRAERRPRSADCRVPQFQSRLGYEYNLRKYPGMRDARAKN